MGAEPHLAAGLPAGHRDDQVALVCLPGGKAQLPGDAFRHTDHPVGEAGGAVLPQQFLKRIHQKGPPGLHCFLCHDNPSLSFIIRLHLT